MPPAARSGVLEFSPGCPLAGDWVVYREPPTPSACGNCVAPPSKNALKCWSNLQVGFWSIWDGFGNQLGLQNRPKSEPTSINNRIMFWIGFLIAFWLIWNWFLRSWSQNPPQIHWKIHAKSHQVCHRFSDRSVIHFNANWVQEHMTLRCCVVGFMFSFFLVHFIIPKPDKIQPKINQTSIKKWNKRSMQFWIDFGKILGGFWKPWVQVGPRIGKKINYKSIDFLIACSIESWSILNGFWAQLGTKWAFLILLGASFGGVLVALGAKMAPRSPQEGPKDQFWTDFGWFLVDFSNLFHRLLIDCWLIWWIVGSPDCSFVCWFPGDGWLVVWLAA